MKIKQDSFKLNDPRKNDKFNLHKSVLYSHNYFRMLQVLVIHL